MANEPREPRAAQGPTRSRAMDRDQRRRVPPAGCQQGGLPRVRADLHGGARPQCPQRLPHQPRRRDLLSTRRHHRRRHPPRRRSHRTAFGRCRRGDAGACRCGALTAATARHVGRRHRAGTASRKRSIRSFGSARTAATSCDERRSPCPTSRRNLTAIIHDFNADARRSTMLALRDGASGRARIRALTCRAKDADRKRVRRVRPSRPAPHLSLSLRMAARAHRDGRRSRLPVRALARADAPRRPRRRRRRARRMGRSRRRRALRRGASLVWLRRRTRAGDGLAGRRRTGRGVAHGHAHGQSAPPVRIVLPCRAVGEPRS